MIVITLHVDAAAAVRALSSAAGPQRIELDDDAIAQLTTEERETLAQHLQRLPGWGEPLHLGAPPIARATFEALRECLSRRCALMSYAAAMCLDPVVLLREPST